TRLDIFRIAGFDMAGDLLQRRCPITANCNQNRRLVENLATNHFLPEPLLWRILRVGLQARDYALSMIAVEWQVPTLCGVWRERWRRRPPYMPPSMRWLRWPAGVSITAQARSSIEMRKTSRSSCLTQHWPSANTWLGQAHAFPRHVRNSRRTLNLRPRRSTVNLLKDESVLTPMPLRISAAFIWGEIVMAPVFLSRLRK